MKAPSPRQYQLIHLINYVKRTNFKANTYDEAYEFIGANMKYVEKHFRNKHIYYIDDPFFGESYYYNYIWEV